MDLTDEVKRLSKVYKVYEEDPSVQARWTAANVGNRWIAKERENGIASLLRSQGFMPLEQRRVLDIGCGRGGVLAGLLDLGAKPQNLYGVDLLPDRIEAARCAYPDIPFACGNAEHLEFPDGHFDLVLFFTVFSLSSMTIWQGMSPAKPSVC